MKKVMESIYRCFPEHIFINRGYMRLYIIYIESYELIKGTFNVMHRIDKMYSKYVVAYYVSLREMR